MRQKSSGCVGRKFKPMARAAVACDAQAVEHYEMARYGTLIAWAKQLKLPDAAKLLEETLGEEKAADHKLSKLASSVNEAAGKTSKS